MNKILMMGIRPKTAEKREEKKKTQKGSWKVFPSSCIVCPQKSTRGEE